MKVALVLALPSFSLLLLLFFALYLGGFFRSASEMSFAIMLLALGMMSVVFTAAAVVLQIAALGLLRLLPWRGPQLKVDEPPRGNLAGIFE